MNFTQSQITELKSALKDKTLIPYHKRIQAVYLRSQKLTYKPISEIIDFSHDTIWRLVKTSVLENRQREEGSMPY